MAEEAYQLLPTIADTIRQQAANNTQKHKYNHVFMDPASQDNIESSRKEPSTGVRQIYSDGSLVLMGKPQSGMAFTVVGEEQPVVHGITKGFASSVKAEMVGLIAGIIATPSSRMCTYGWTTRLWSSSSKRSRSIGNERLSGRNYDATTQWSGQ